MALSFNMIDSLIKGGDTETDTPRRENAICIHRHKKKTAM